MEYLYVDAVKRKYAMVSEQVNTSNA